MTRTISVFAVLLLFLASFTTSENKKLTLENALKTNMIVAKVIGLGGHQGYCVEISATNTTDHDTTFWIEPGRRLESADTTVQDILLVKEIPMFVKAGQTVTFPLYGFCCQASCSSPKASEVFDNGKMADSNLVRLARFLAKNKYEDEVMQHAIWIVSDKHSISSITATTPEDRKNIRPLQTFLSAMMNLKEQFPWYSLSYKQDTTRLFSGNADSLFGDVEFEVWNQSLVKLIVNDDKGRVIKRLLVNKPFSPGKYSYEVKLDVSTWKKGKYFVRLYSDEQRKLEKAFEL